MQCCSMTTTILAMCDVWDQVLASLAALGIAGVQGVLTSVVPSCG